MVSTVAIMVTIKPVLTVSDSTIKMVRTLRRRKFLSTYLKIIYRWTYVSSKGR